jgi:hypothetical protein
MSTLLAGNSEGVVADAELDRAIISALGVRRAEFNVGRADGAGMSTRELAEELGESVEVVAWRLDELLAVGHIVEPGCYERRWISRRQGNRPLWPCPHV